MFLYFFLLAGQTELGEVASKWCTLLGVVEKEPTREARGDKVGRRVHSSKFFIMSTEFDKNISD